MTSITTSNSMAILWTNRVHFANESNEQVGKLASGMISEVKPETTISTLASRLARAAQNFSSEVAGVTRTELSTKAQGNVDEILYTLDDTHKAAAAKEVPQPNDAQSIASAAAANAYVNDNSEPNPFAGLSREQLATIANDESGTFTINERRSAFMQAYNEEQAWRSKVVEEAQREHEQTGKLTNFFKVARGHFESLPLMEQVLYPADYASNIASKILQSRLGRFDSDPRLQSS